MRNVKTTLLITTLILVVVGSADAAQTRRMTAKEKRVKALELLDKYAETQGKIRSSFISKHETTVKFEGYDLDRPALKKGIFYKKHMELELRSDGNRYYSFYKSWGDRPGSSPIAKEHSGDMQVLWDGESRYQYLYNPVMPAKSPVKKGRLYLTPKARLTIPPSRICDSADGGPLRGFFYGSNERIDSDIRQSKTISLQPETEEINGSQCYVINARTKRCIYKIWIDPEHDYHIAKAIVNRNWWSASRPEKRRKKPTDGTCRIVLKNVRFKKIGDVWLPAECDHTLNTNPVGAAYLRSRYHHKITEYVVNPDHDTLGSFETDFIRDGAFVHIIGVEGITYTWRDGKVVDDKGKVVMDCRKKPKTKKPNVEVEREIMSEKEIEQGEYRYLLFLPDGYGESELEWPLILFLHGAGERGNDLELVKKHGPPKIVETDKEFGFVVVSPQCPREQWWSNDKLKLLLDEVTAKYNVDEKRIYLTGLSMGGKGTWDLACAYPDRFAAIAPVCGWGDPEKASNIKNMPIWAFHGAEDKAVPISKDQVMVDAVKACGGNVKFTIYPDTGHDCWTVTYENNELYDWFLKHRRK